MRARSAVRITEQEFQQQVIDLGHLLGWRVAHFRPAQTAKGWRTPATADGKGFPDLVLVRERVIFAELKTDRGKLTDDQAAWLAALAHAGAEAYIWRPSEFDAVEHHLRRTEATDG